MEHGTHVESESFCERIAKERNCSPELIRAIGTDYLRRLHELAVKEGLGASMFAAYFEIGDLAAWHFGGILEVASGQAPGELVETYKRMDPTMRRFRWILDQWEFELKSSPGENPEECNHA